MEAVAAAAVDGLMAVATAAGPVDELDVGPAGSAGRPSLG